MKKRNGISNNALAGIIGLEAIVLGIFIGLKMGFSFEPPSPLSSIVTIGGTRHVIGTIAALIFIPIFAKQIKAGFLVALIFTTATLILTVGSISDFLFITPGYRAKVPVPIAMAIIQVLVMWFSYRAWKETA